MIRPEAAAAIDDYFYKKIELDMGSLNPDEADLFFQRSAADEPLVNTIAGFFRQALVRLKENVLPNVHTVIKYPHAGITRSRNN